MDVTDMPNASRKSSPTQRYRTCGRRFVARCAQTLRTASALRGRSRWCGHFALRLTPLACGRPSTCRLVVLCFCVCMCMRVVEENCCKLHNNRGWHHRNRNARHLHAWFPEGPCHLSVCSEAPSSSAQNGVRAAGCDLLAGHEVGELVTVANQSRVPGHWLGTGMQRLFAQSSMLYGGLCLSCKGEVEDGGTGSPWATLFSTRWHGRATCLCSPPTQISRKQWSRRYWGLRSAQLVWP